MNIMCVIYGTIPKLIKLTVYCTYFFSEINSTTGHNIISNL